MAFYFSSRLREIVAASMFDMNVNRRRANMIFKICNRFRKIFIKFPSIIYLSSFFLKKEREGGPGNASRRLGHRPPAAPPGLLGGTHRPIMALA